MLNKRYASLIAATCALTLSATSARAAEHHETVNLNRIPAPAAHALEKSARGGTITTVEKEKEAGQVAYEAKIEARGHIREVTVDANGNVLKIEHVITLSEVPRAARHTIEAEAKGAQILKIERVIKGRETTYKAIVAKGRTHEKIVVSSRGQLIERTAKKASR
jgi:hypothetical protein